MAAWSEILARIPRSQFRYSFSRSSGPGGQNVNKVNTKATIRIARDAVAAAVWLDPDVRAKITEPQFQYATKRGDIVVSSELTRSQRENLNDCFVKLAQAIERAAFKPLEPSLEALQRWEALQRRESVKKKETKKRHAAKKQDRKL